MRFLGLLVGLGDGEEIMEIITAAAVGAKNSIASFSTNSRYDRPPSEGDVPTSDFSGPGSHLRPLHAGWQARPPLSWERGVTGELCNMENLAKLFLEEHAAADKRAVGITLKC